MDYFSLALISSILWACVNIIDKHVVGEFEPKPFVALLPIAFVSLLSSIIVFCFEGIPSISLTTLLLALICGALYLTSFIFYIKAISLDDVSKLAPISFISPLIVLPASTLILGEQYSFYNVLGILFLTLGAIGLTLDEKFNIKINKALLFILLSTLCGPIILIISKYLLEYNVDIQIFAISRFGFALAGFPILVWKSKDILDFLKLHGLKPYYMMGGNQVINMLGVILNTTAIQLGKVSTVNSLASLQPLFLILLTVIISKYQPKFKIETISRNTFFRRLVSISILVVGAILCQA